MICLGKARNTNYYYGTMNRVQSGNMSLKRGQQSGKGIVSIGRESRDYYCTQSKLSVSIKVKHK